MSKLMKSMLAVFALLFVFSVAVPAYAHEGEEHEESKPETTVIQEQKDEAAARQKEAQKKREEAKAKANDKREEKQARLTNSRLKACQRREKVINNLMTKLADRGTRQIEVFDKISDRTQVFYQEKGQTLSNYETLVTEVDSKKNAAESTVAKTKESIVGFKCDGTDPKGVASQFKENLRAQNDALKAYKTAIKNLIVGVKSVQVDSSESQGAN